MKNVSAIITGDWHLRDDQPMCRTDDFFETQARKVLFVVQLQEKYGSPILDAGDLLNKWRPTPFLLAWAINHLPGPGQHFVTPGNHEMPGHDVEMLHKSGLAVLSAANMVTVLDVEGININGVQIYGFPWMSKLENKMPRRKAKRNVAVVHAMTYADRTPWPGLVVDKANVLLNRLDAYDLIITGHNHQSFVVEERSDKRKRLLINPGCITRQTADMADHKPCVYLWDADNNEVEQVLVPIEKDVVIREHLERGGRRGDRVEAFVTRLNDEYAVELSFEKNLESYYSKNRTRQSVKEIIYKAMEV